MNPSHSKPGATWPTLDIPHDGISITSNSTGFSNGLWNDKVFHGSFEVYWTYLTRQCYNLYELSYHKAKREDLRNQHGQHHLETGLRSTLTKNQYRDSLCLTAPMLAYPLARGFCPNLLAMLLISPVTVMITKDFVTISPGCLKDVEMLSNFPMNSLTLYYLSENDMGFHIHEYAQPFLVFSCRPIPALFESCLWHLGFFSCLLDF